MHAVILCKEFVHQSEEEEMNEAQTLQQQCPSWQIIEHLSSKICSNSFVGKSSTTFRAGVAIVQSDRLKHKP
jgi:hypothetical protein